jgi:hypothetical protein
MSLLHFVGAWALVLGVWSAPCQGAGANDFTISLKVQSGKREQTAVSGQSAAPVLTAKAKEVIWVQWSVANGTSGNPLSDVTVHVFMDRGDLRAAAPKPGPKALYESALIQDFEAGAKNSGEFRMPLPEAGTYLLRVETIGAAKKLGKEISAVMQVSVP